jgi:hypothetical protein
MTAYGGEAMSTRNFSSDDLTPSRRDVVKYGTATAISAAKMMRRCY